MDLEIIKIRALAGSLKRLEPTSDEQIALVGFMAGALFALDLAASQGYSDERSRPDPTEFAKEFRLVLGAVSAGSAIDQSFHAGFLYNSALMRLAALNHRLDKATGEFRDDGAAIRRSVNTLKHDVDAHISGDKPIAFVEAVNVADVLAQRLIEFVLRGAA